MISRRHLIEGTAAVVGVAGLGAKAAQAPANDTDDTLRELLERNRGHHPIYGGGLANHLSMELCALAALGATSERMREFARGYETRLDPLPPATTTVDATNWRSAVGHADALPALIAHFSADLRARGRAVVLREALEQFAPSLASELFHCLIRTAYGVRFDDDEEIAHGLACWAIKPLALATLAPAPGTEHDFDVLLACVRDTPSLARAQLTGGSNPDQMRQASRLDGFARIVNALAVDDRTLARLARSARALYAATNNFVALHAVTATHALRVLLPYASDPVFALRHHAQGLIAAYVRIGAPPIDASSDVQAPEWDAIATKAIASADDHDAKFVFSCREERRAYDEELYRRAAAQRVRLV